MSPALDWMDEMRELGRLREPVAEITASHFDMPRVASCLTQHVATGNLLVEAHRRAATPRERGGELGGPLAGDARALVVELWVELEESYRLAMAEKAAWLASLDRAEVDDAHRRAAEDARLQGAILARQRKIAAREARRRASLLPTSALQELCTALDLRCDTEAVEEYLTARKRRGFVDEHVRDAVDRILDAIHGEVREPLGRDELAQAIDALCSTGEILAKLQEDRERARRAHREVAR